MAVGDIRRLRFKYSFENISPVYLFLRNRENKYKESQLFS
jgi:hypothetical protein